MKVSIIIPTYNRAQYIGVTIQSFLELNYPKENYEIIIVNNKSTDNTEEVVLQFVNNAFGVKLHYVYEPRQGVHYARNTAAKQAKNELLYFTDDDMIADKELLSEIIKPFLFDPLVADVTGRVLPKWLDEPPKWILEHCNNYLLSLLSPDYDFLIADSINYLYSCHQAIRRDVFFQAEGFNPEYTKGKYMGDGETGLNRKVKKLGYKFGYNGKSIIYHMIPKSRCTQAYLNKRFENNGRAHAYSSFREKGSAYYLPVIVLKSLLYKIPVDIFHTVTSPGLKKNFKAYLTLHHILAGKLFYIYGNLAFCLGLLFRKNLRKFTLKQDWLSNDQEFDSIDL